MERRLGRGLGSLLGQSETERNPAAASESEGVKSLPLKVIRPNPNQPRKVFDSEHLEELRQSIEAHGVLQPILVRPVGNGLFEIISGERRWRAARLAGLELMPVVVRTADEKQTLELAIVENVQRRDLDPIEKAKGFQTLAEQFGMSHDTIAQRVGMQRPSVANHVRLLELPHVVQEGVSAGLITMGHARALLSFEGAEARLSAFERVVRDELSVRETERLAKDASPLAAVAAEAARAGKGEASNAPGGGKGLPGPKERESWIASVEQRMRDHLGSKVELVKSKGYRGKITVYFNGREDLERIIDILGPKDLL